MATHYKVLGEDLPRNKQRAYLVTAGGLDGKEEFFLSPGPNAVWEPDTSATVCSAEGCSTELTSGALYGSNRHHCRVCGEIFCDDCSSAKLPVLDSLSTYSPVFFGKARGQNVARGEVTVTIDATHTRGRMAFIHEQARVCANCFGLACQFAAKTHLVTNGPMRRAEHLIEAAIPKTGSSQGCLRALATIFTISRGNRRNTLLTVLAVDGAKTLVNAAEIKS